jgi:hypothetical protein
VADDDGATFESESAWRQSVEDQHTRAKANAARSIQSL